MNDSRSITGSGFVEGRHPSFYCTRNSVRIGFVLTLLAASATLLLVHGVSSKKFSTLIPGTIVAAGVLITIIVLIYKSIYPRTPSLSSRARGAQPQEGSDGASPRVAKQAPAAPDAEPTSAFVPVPLSPLSQSISASGADSDSGNSTPNETPHSTPPRKSTTPPFVPPLNLVQAGLVEPPPAQPAVAPVVKEKERGDLTKELYDIVNGSWRKMKKMLHNNDVSKEDFTKELHFVLQAVEERAVMLPKELDQKNLYCSLGGVLSFLSQMFQWEIARGSANAEVTKARCDLVNKVAAAGSTNGTILIKIFIKSDSEYTSDESVQTILSKFLSFRFEKPVKIEDGNETDDEDNL